MLLQRMFYGCMCVGVRIKGALINAVCKKSFQMHTIDKQYSSACVSFVASDINKVYDGCQDIHFLWTCPIEAGAILTILAILIGVYAFPGKHLMLATSGPAWTEELDSLNFLFAFSVLR
jgi:hypothetical protein